MFQIIETTKTYNRGGNVVASSDRVVYETADPIASVLYRYRTAKGGCFVSHSGQRSVTLSTRRDDEKVDFETLFRIVEGDDAADRILSGDLDPVNEEDWIASKPNAVAKPYVSRLDNLWIALDRFGRAILSTTDLAAAQRALPGFSR